MKKLKLSRKKLIGLIVVILVVALAVVFAVSAGGSSSRYLETTVENRDIVSYLEFSGNIEASDVSTVYASVTAQVTEVAVEEGDYVEAGDVIAVKENRKKDKYFEQIKTMKVGNMPKWLEFDPEKLEGKVIELPKREDIDSQIAEHMIVEFYSK